MPESMSRSASAVCKLPRRHQADYSKSGFQFRHTIGVFQQGSGNVDIFSFEQKQFVVYTLLSGFEAVKQMPRSDIFGGFGIAQPKILPDTQIISDVFVVEIFDPLLADKFAVSDKGADALGAEQPYKPVKKSCPLNPVGVAALVEHGKKQWKCNALVCHSEHKDIDVGLSEFPVGVIKAQNQSGFDRQKRKYHFGDKVEVEGVTGKKSLEATQIGIAFYACRHGRRYLVEADCLHHTEGMEEQRHKFYACQIHVFSQMFLHNREDWLTLTQSLELVVFIRKYSIARLTINQSLG